ncbi:RidA family protein [Dickeya dianthicola]|uniref:RidA family protein n=1 Tax=Dickeya dianthicola TaxID=204039 RepID=A0AAP6VGF8_9GAMM|nr:Rid family hydrolase [Dickeya dianthicola]ATO33247.1 RidA superfamily, group 2 YoaB-like protein [Dickeya dianthicola RNS04.9]MBT1428212.1 RidA family protein [Dickeya dianthicola]MBT1432280.1 RidA family protein [Dickeya dianthicola]MBT1459726.1 RidA family protein [Dickeya dianthicola]MBT1488925.1 RidA family protein [Dickeya dianthicola]
MSITRINPDARWSDAVIYNNTLYYTSVPENLDDDALAQTENALASLDAILQQAGSDKSRLLDVTLFLADAADFAAMNAAWDAWVAAGSAPVRCTVEARLMNPKFKVEIKAIAAVG